MKLQLKFGKTWDLHIEQGVFVIGIGITLLSVTIHIWTIGLHKWLWN